MFKRLLELFFPINKPEYDCGYDWAERKLKRHGAEAFKKLSGVVSVNQILKRRTEWTSGVEQACVDWLKRQNN